MLKNFFIKDLFEVINNPQLDKENFTFSESAEYPYFTRTENNNGILGYVEYLDEEHKIKGNSLAVGMISMRFHYMHHDFYAGQFTKTLMPKFQGFDEKLAMYFIVILNKHSEYYQSFLVRHFKDKVSETVVALPVIESPVPNHKYTVDDIDWQYMRERIAELERERIAELERERIAELDAYLVASGLNNYKLTDEDKKILSSSTMQMFKEFDLSMFFDISTTKSVDKNKLDFAADGEYDFIGRTSVNWGIQGKLHKLSFEPNPKDSFSLVQVGETVALWREKEWYASQNLFLLNPRIDEVKENKLYFQGVINKEMSRYGKEYSSYPTMKSLTATKIFLPVIESPDPDHEYTPADIDWHYMERYIRAVEKLTIADVVRYKDRMITAAKQVIDI